MKRILAFNGSPRPSGNSVHLLNAFLEGAGESSAQSETVTTHGLDLKECNGCLRCNLLKRCALSGDAWEGIRDRVTRADILVFASPVYFHHLPASLKRVLDRFRSFTHVKITETGLEHTPWEKWEKRFVLLLSQGSADRSDSEPVIDLFRFITGIMGPGNTLHSVVGTRLAVSGHVAKSEEELRNLYGKMDLPARLAAADARKNAELLRESRDLGARLAGTGANP